MKHLSQYLVVSNSNNSGSHDLSTSCVLATVLSAFHDASLNPYYGAAKQVLIPILKMKKPSPREVNLSQITQFVIGKAGISGLDNLKARWFPDLSN